MKIPFKMNKENACILILAGVLCMVSVWPTSNKEKETLEENTMFLEENMSEEVVDASSTLNVYIQNQEERLERILEQIDGAGRVEVMIRAEASKEYVVEKDITNSESSVTETDSEGGTRQNFGLERSESSVFTKDTSGNDIPWVIKELEPTIEGVLVAVQGADQESVASEITQAVQVLFDIPVHKIKVVKMKME